MSHYAGEPVRGILHSTDASAGVAIPIFNQGSVIQRTIGSDEYLEIHSIRLVTVAGGDCYVLIGPDATLGTGETVVRGTFAANSGLSASILLHTGRPSWNPFLVAPVGVVDVEFTGVIRRADHLGRAAYQASLVPGQ